MRVTSRLAIRVFHLYFKGFIDKNVKVFDTNKKPHPPAPSPTERGSAGNGLLRDDLKTSRTHKGYLAFHAPLHSERGWG